MLFRSRRYYELSRLLVLNNSIHLKVLKIAKHKTLEILWLSGKQSACQCRRCGFHPWVRRNVSHRCLLQLPKGPEPTQTPRALLLGTVRVLRDPGSVLGQKESPRLGPPQGRSFPVLHSGAARSTELGFLAEAGSCRPQPPGSPGPSSWNIPGCPAPPGTTGDRPGTQEQTRLGEGPALRSPGGGLIHTAGVGEGREWGRTTGSASGPGAQTPELPRHRKNKTHPQVSTFLGSVAAAHKLCCPEACGVFPDQGLNPCPLHWQVDS